MKSLVILLCLIPLISFPSITLKSNTPDAPYESGSVTWSPDGTMLMGGIDSGKIRVWNALSGEILFDLDVGSIGGGAAWSPDGQRIAAVGEGTLIYLWDVNAPHEPTLLTTNYIQPITSIAWSPDSKFLVIGSQALASLQIWDMSSYKMIRDYMEGGILQVAWHPITGNPVFVRGLGAIYSLDWLKDSTGSSVRLKLTPNLSATSVAFSPDKKKMAVGNALGEIHILDTQTYKEITILRGHNVSDPENIWTFNGAVTYVAWNKDNSVLASAGNDKTVRVWDVETSTLLTVIENGKSENTFTGSLGWSPYGGRLAFPANAAIYETNARSELGSSLQSINNGTIQVVVPVPSIDRLKPIAPLCLEDAEAPSSEAVELLSKQAMDALDKDKLPKFVEKVKKLKKGDIPAACAADLIAVAEAVIAAP
jgi:WD40 repeat protein